MTLAELNSKIDRIPYRQDREEARVARDTRLGILGCHAGMEPTEEQIAIVHQELFGESPCLFSQPEN
jgi:hypothetical protein